ncbi:T9SS type B sorting domain-containing protein [Flavobacterium rhizosphaerae]|uniref:T9SS type B sorting domain-containing protein n=1 Tax=Flavobacterium rhizosphaerae TaxID=3163298 RepID=A0ABW8YYZ0_9FLAO
MRNSWKRNITSNRIKFFCVACVVFLNIARSYSQLSDFTLNVIPTNETCTGNGSLTFNVEGGTPGATFLFNVVLLPDGDNLVTSSTVLEGLSAGTYQVTALQTLGAFSNSVQQTVTIEQEIVNLTYSIYTVTQNCDTGGQVVINVLTGTAASYEIFSGPVTMPLQESNVFTNLPEGFYYFRVYDECGEAIVQNFTVEYDIDSPTVSQPIFSQVNTGDCNTFTITNTITYPETTTINYPLTIEYIIHPADGGDDIISTQTFYSGAPSFLEFSHEFPFDGATYTYDIVVTNGCGMQYGNSGMIVNPVPSLTISDNPLPCGEYYITLNVSNFMPPYTVEFLDQPVGFSPVAYNGNHPGPFTNPLVNYGGLGAPLPEGVYEVQITDACGRTASDDIEIIYDLLPPTVESRNNGCFSNSGRITVSFPDREVVSATITEAPAAYTESPDITLPQNVSSFINSSGKLVLINMPVGDYVIDITDSCGGHYTVEVTVPPFEELEFEADPQPDCSPQTGGVIARSRNGKLVTMFVIAAPLAYPEALPHDVSDKIAANGKLYMTNLPLGNYTLQGVDVCGIQKQVSFTLVNENIAIDDLYVFEAHCNSFDILLDDNTVSDMATPVYWLQVENPSSPGEWMHPETGIVYTEGDIPNSDNSYQLQNNHNNINLVFYGHLRIVRSFTTVGDGVAEKNCIEILGEFDYYDGVVVENIYDLSCVADGGDISVYIEAGGLAPIQYRIISKNGQDFLVENGTNNVFEGLEPGVYVFQVEDSCGNKVNRIQNISQLPDLTSANQPDDMLLCIERGQPDQQEFDLTQQNSTILGLLAPDIYTVTYYDNIDDAESGSNPLPYNYTNNTNPQTIYARVEHNYIGICHSITQFDIQVSEYPDVETNSQVTICDNQGEVVLIADAGFDSYLWSTGQTSRSITVTEPGIYTVNVSNIYGSNTCDVLVSIEVAASDEPEITDITITDWTENDNSITVSASGADGYLYSLDGIVWQESPTFDNLEPDIYTVYVRDTYGCGIVTQEVALLNYPKFFTPNGDGHHETWRIPNSWIETGLMTYIFDRYGKLITSFDTQSIGWDGTYNGKKLPSTDYWFVVKREDGRVYKGHFAMIR